MNIRYSTIARNINEPVFFLFFISLGSLPVCWPSQCWVASFPELDWDRNTAACPSSGCNSAPAMGRVWGGRNQWGGSPLLVQRPTGSPGFWTQAGPQLCRRGSQHPQTDCSKCPQLIHTQLGQHGTLTHTHTHTHTHTRMDTGVHTWPDSVDGLKQEGGSQLFKYLVELHFYSSECFPLFSGTHSCLPLVETEGSVFVWLRLQREILLSLYVILALTKYGAEGRIADLTGQWCCYQIYWLYTKQQIFVCNL